MPIRGRIKWFCSKKGYGFIEREGGEDVFAHYTDIVDPEETFRYLQRGSEVEFEIVDGERGPRASHIVKVENSGTENRKPD